MKRLKKDLQQEFNKIACKIPLNELLFSDCCDGYYLIRIAFNSVYDGLDKKETRITFFGENLEGKGIIKNNNYKDFKKGANSYYKYVKISEAWNERFLHRHRKADVARSC